MEIFLTVIILAVAGFASYFISSRLHRKLVKSSNKYPMLFSVLTFAGSFLIILAAILFIIIYNMSFER